MMLISARFPPVFVGYPDGYPVTRSEVATRCLAQDYNWMGRQCNHGRYFTVHEIDN